MGLFVAFFGGIGLIFVMGYNMGNYWGIKEGGGPKSLSIVLRNQNFVRKNTTTTKH